MLFKWNRATSVFIHMKREYLKYFRGIQSPFRMITFLISKPVRLPILLATTKITLEYRLHTATILCSAAIIKTRRTFEGYGFVVTSNVIPAMHCADRYGKMLRVPSIYFAALWVVRFLNVFDLHVSCSVRRNSALRRRKNFHTCVRTLLRSISTSNKNINIIIIIKMFKFNLYADNLYGDN